MLLPYLDRLDPERQQVFKKLKRFSEKFVLAGGTAIMLQTGYRLSFDFDCFTSAALSPTILRKARDTFGRILLPTLRTSEQLTLTTEKGVGVTFVYHPYKSLRRPIPTESIPVFQMDDLAANKAYTIGRRGVWRDYIDLFFLLKWKLYDLGTIISLAEKKFNGEFSDKLFLEQLSYFTDIEIVPTTFLKESYEPAEIKAFLERKVRKYVRKILG